jgi:hypothetical protein
MNFEALLSKGGPWERAEIVGDALLLQGDCREILPTLPQFDLILTDPPYTHPGLFEFAIAMAMRRESLRSKAPPCPACGEAHQIQLTGYHFQFPETEWRCRMCSTKYEAIIPLEES